MNLVRPGSLWERLRAQTAARIGISHIDGAMTTAALLDFQQSHALARDAVWRPLDASVLAADLDDLSPIIVSSQASTRAEYLARPDLGRRLAPADGTRLAAGDKSLAIVIADGLSSTAVHRHAAGLTRELLERLPGVSVARPVIAAQGRVAIGDEIAALLGCSIVVVLIGERPGLSAADSLGAYVTREPKIGRKDSERNCVSNIRPEGCAIQTAAHMIAWLVRAALDRGLTGVGLKDESGPEMAALPHQKTGEQDEA